jgi:hypothetical protein
MGCKCHNCSCYSDHAGQQQLCGATEQGGSMAVLLYLQELGVLLSIELLISMLRAVAVCDKLSAARWLSAQGAEWPSAFEWSFWSSDVQVWSIAEGYTDPNV